MTVFLLVNDYVGTAWGKTTSFPKFDFGTTISEKRFNKVNLNKEVRKKSIS